MRRLSVTLIQAFVIALRLDIHIRIFIAIEYWEKILRASNLNVFVCPVSSNIGWNFLEISWKYFILSKFAHNACVGGLTHKFFRLDYHIRQLQI